MTMMEAGPGPSPEQMQLEAQVAEMDPAQREAQLREQITGPLNTALNEEVSHKNQAADAEKLTLPLKDADASLDISRELRLLAAGELSDDQLSDGAKDALATGETMDSMFSRATQALETYKSTKEQAEADLDFDEILDEARDSYIGLLMKRSGIRGRKTHRAALAEAENAYNTALVNKIARVMEMDPTHRKAPYVIPTNQMLQKEKPTLENLQGNQLHVLVDQLAREQLAKARAIEALSNRGIKRVLNALSNNRALRVAVGSAVWAGSLVASNKGLLPENMEGISDAADKVLPLVAGYYTSREVMTGVNEGLEKRKASRQMKRDIADLTSTTFLTEATLRTIYSDVEYQEGNITKRRAGDTPEENQAAIGNINSEFVKLEREGARGGKPYSAEKILPYVADLYLRRKDQVDAVVSSDDPKQAFLQLCGEVIAADTKELTDRQQANRAKRAAFRALSACTSVFAGQWVSQLRDAQEATTRPIKMVSADAV